MKLSTEAKLALLVARRAIFKEEIYGFDSFLTQTDIEWEKVRYFMSYHELSSFAYPYLRKYSSYLPDAEIEYLKNSYYSCLFYVSYLWQEFIRIITVFNAKGIVSAPLKGIAFIADNLYSDKSFLRPMCDIDLLIKKKDLDFAETVMKDLGYSKDTHGLKDDYWRNQNYHLAFLKKPQRNIAYSVEIHWNLDYKRDRQLLPHLWNRIRKKHVEGLDVYLLSLEDTIFCLALHQRRFGNTLSLKNACDLALLLNRYNSKLDWDYIVREASTGRMRTTLYFTLLQAYLLLDSRIPLSILNELRVPKYKKVLIERFILGNTFRIESNSGNYENARYLYLKQHFLLYDDLWEPLRYILNIPQEQFAKFYKIHPYAPKTYLLYIARYIFFLNNILMSLARNIYNKIARFSEERQRLHSLL